MLRRRIKVKNILEDKKNRRTEDWRCVKVESIRMREAGVSEDRCGGENTCDYKRKGLKLKKKKESKEKN